MKGIEIKSLCVLFLVSFCVLLNSCGITENIFQSTSEVDFTTPQNVQISFNERVYDTTIEFNDYGVEINFINEKSLFNGACVTVSSKGYKISYNDLDFEGEAGALSAASLPWIVYGFFSSFENIFILDSFDKERNCYYVKRNVNNHFVVLEAYEKENEATIYSMEIK